MEASPKKGPDGDTPCQRKPADVLRELARTGTLARVAADSDQITRRGLVSAAYEVAAPVVFARITKQLEHNRGHWACASSMERLSESCHDQFLDDVEAVVNDLLQHARSPIHSVEGWIASRARAATIDGNRLRRGSRGALQRPRMPGWLKAKLGDDRWLESLAIEVLTWVGVPADAGTGIWPLDSWAERRALAIEDPTQTGTAAVIRDIETVLAAMRSRPQWFERFVEQPLAHKQPKVAETPNAEMVSPLVLNEVDEAHNRALTAIAASMLDEIRSRIGRNEDPRTAVVDVISTAFTSDYHIGHDLPPFAEPNEDRWVADMLKDPAATSRIIKAVLEILR